MFVEIIIFLIALVLFAFLLHQKPKDLPPGEWGLPVVGYIPYMNWKMSESLIKLQEKHGKIYSLKLGVLTLIVIGDYQLIKEAYNKPEISGRPYIYSFDLLLKDISLGLVTSEGHVWTTNRRFAIKTLKDFGLGKSKLEQVVYVEAEYLVKELKKTVDKPSRIDWNLNVAVLNIIWRLVGDCRHDISDKRINDFAQSLFEALEEMEGRMALLNIFPWLKSILPTFIKNSWMKISALEKKRDKIFDYLSDVLDEHKKTLNPNDPRDYIDKYLIEMEKNKDNPEYEHIGEFDLLVSMFQLFAAGSETTSSTLRWFFIYMAKFPHVQKRVQEELDKVMPRDKIPAWDDKEKLPCLHALSYEVGRIISLLPNSVAHAVVEDTTLAGYLIPKGALVVPNTEVIHKDPKYWKHPNEFSIDNFLDEEGKFVSKIEGYLPFSIGRRQCLGEPVAKMELFIFMGAILQNFDILEPKGQPVSLIPDQSVNLFNFPEKCDILLKNRK